MKTVYNSMYKSVFILLLFSSSLFASSYRQVEGTYKEADYKVQVYWADIYNFRPTKKHFMKTTVKVRPSSDYQRNGHCELEQGRQNQTSATGEFTINKKHVRAFSLKCNFRSAKDKSMLTIDQSFRVEQEAKSKKGPFERPLIIKPVKN